MEKFLENLKLQAEENPMLAIAAAGALAGGLSKLVNSLAWKQEVRRRAMKDLAKRK